MYAMSHLVLFGVVGSIFGASGDAGPLSESDFRRQVSDTQDRIKSISVVYVDSDYPPDYPKGYFNRQVTIAQSPDRLRQLVAHGHDRFAWQDDPLQQEAFVNGDKYVRYNSVNRTCLFASLEGASELPGKMNASLFFVATGIWPLERWKPYRPEGHPHVLSEVIRSEEYRLADEVEEFDQVKCHVFECPGRDRLFFDMARVAMLRRELFDDDTGQLMQVFCYRNLLECDRGIWLPRSIRETHYDIYASTIEGRRRIVRDSDIILSEILVNSEVDEKLNFVVPDGALELREGGAKQITGNASTHFESVAEWCQKQVGRRPPNKKWLFDLMWCPIAGVATFLLWNGIRCRKTGAPNPDGAL